MSGKESRLLSEQQSRDSSGKKAGEEEWAVTQREENR